MKKIISIALALVMMLSVMMVAITNVSAEIVDSGECGDNVTWTLDDSGVLTISGEGPMYDYGGRETESGDIEIIESPFCRNWDITQIIIGNGVTSIGDEVFYDCGVESITIPNSVESIGNSALLGCSNLESIDIPASVTSIGSSVFFDCASLTSITIPNSVTTIGARAFWRCENLTSITIPNRVTNIGWNMFYRCKSLANITIPDSVTSIDNSAFDGGYSSHTDVYTSNQIAINYFLNRDFHHSILGEYYVNYVEEIPTPQTPDNEITVSGNNGQSIVTLDYDTANLRVTVPTVLPVSVDSDNNVTVSDSAQIVNGSNGQVDVTNAVLSGNNSWTLAAFDTDFTKLPVNTKQYGFELQGYNVPVSGDAYNSQFDTIAGDASLDLSYDANVAIQSEAIDGLDIGRIVFTVAWHK